MNEKGLLLWKSEKFEYMQGIGVKGIVEGKEVIAVGPNYFIENKLGMPVVPSEIDQDTETVNYVLIEGKLIERSPLQTVCGTDRKMLLLN